MPCRLRGNGDAGFEILSGPPDDLFGEDWRRLVSHAEDYCMAFTWGGSMIEGASASIAAHALAKRHGATVSYEGQNPLTLAEQEAEIAVFLAELDAEPATPAGEEPPPRSWLKRLFGGD